MTKKHVIRRKNAALMTIQEFTGDGNTEYRLFNSADEARNAAQEIGLVEDEYMIEEVKIGANGEPESLVFTTERTMLI